MSTARLLQSLFGHKTWADDELLLRLRDVDAEAHAAERHAALRIANHIHVVDRLFQAQLQRLPLPFSATNTPETPTLEDLHAASQATDRWYLQYIASQEDAALDERIAFRFADGDPGGMSRAEMLLHVAGHGSYHRGAIGRILSQLSVAPPRDLLTRFLHGSEPERRRADP